MTVLKGANSTSTCDAILCCFYSSQFTESRQSCSVLEQSRSTPLLWGRIILHKTYLHRTSFTWGPLVICNKCGGHLWSQFPVNCEITIPLQSTFHISPNTEVMIILVLCESASHLFGIVIRNFVYSATFSYLFSWLRVLEAALAVGN